MNTRAEPAVVLEPPAYVKNKALIAWVGAIASLTQPDKVLWCDGSDAEYDRLCQQLVAAGTFHKLDPVKRPVSAVADQHEVREIAEVSIGMDRSRELTLLFDPEHALDDRITMEQFIA